MQDEVKTAQSLSIRCSYCGAPLDKPEEGSEFVKCGSCGTTQKMVDAQAFLEQIMGHVYGWVRSAIPTGFDISRSENSDPIARHNIFISYVRPRLTTEFGEYRFNMLNLLSNQLITTPFKCIGIATKNDPSQAFELNAKSKSISPLAVDEESRSLVSEVDRYTAAYAYLLNNIRLMQNNAPERYSLMAANFTASFELFRDDKGSSALANRLLGLAHTSTSVDLLMKGNISGASESLAKARDALENAKKETIGNLKFGTMYQGILKEIQILSTTDSMCRAADMDPRGDPLSTIATIERIVKVACETESGKSARWSAVLRDDARFEEIMGWAMTIRGAQKGTSRLNTVSGGGNVLFPFWLVDFPYSFKTGALWMKKGVEVTETVIVSASFITDDALISNPSYCLTDIFGNYEASGVLDSLTGKETSISNGATLRSISNSLNFQYASGRSVIPPLSTRKEVSMLIEDYVARVVRADSNVAKKLKLSAPQIKGLIFVPGDINPNGYSVNMNFGALSPRYIGNLGRMIRAME